MPHPAGRKLRTRERILNGARRRFLAQGFEATTIEQVMHDVGLTRGGFYGHFASKRALYAAAMAAPGSPPSQPPTSPPDDAAPAVSWVALASDLAGGPDPLRALAAGRFLHLAQALATPARPAPDDRHLALAALQLGAGVAGDALEPAARERLARACQALTAPTEAAAYFWTPDPTAATVGR